MATQAFKDKFHKNHFEQTAWKDNNFICGIDEVGRGCLAGPVVVAAVVLFPHKLSRHLRDSKIMTLEEREKAYRWIMNNSWNSIALVHHRTIDSKNIYHATLIAMKRAYMQLMSTIPHKPTTILVDAMPLKLNNTAYENTTNVYYFPFGESKSSSIAAASIIAKVTRDRLMVNHFEKIIPGYEIQSNKGYGTPPHKRHIRSLGHSIIHRMNFLATVWQTTDQSNQQQSLFYNSEVIEQSGISIASDQNSLENFKNYNEGYEHEQEPTVC